VALNRRAGCAGRGGLASKNWAVVGAGGVPGGQREQETDTRERRRDAWPAGLQGASEFSRSRGAGAREGAWPQDAAGWARTLRTGASAGDVAAHARFQRKCFILGHFEHDFLQILNGLHKVVNRKVVDPTTLYNFYKGSRVFFSMVFAQISAKL
jgi:hypothetical protein